MKKRGISLIVLIVTIIVIIILAAVVILTLSKNNPIESAKEATFKEDIRTFQDELAMYIAKDYTSKGGARDNKITETDSSKIKDYIPSFNKKYEGKFVIKNDELMYQEIVEGKELEWCKSLNIKSNVKSGAEKAKENVNDYYGKTVNYSVNGINDWKIFYTDGSNIFLITSGYVDPEKLPSKGEGIQAAKPENASPNSNPKAANFTNELLSKYSGSIDITDKKMKDLNSEYFKERINPDTGEKYVYTSTNDNMKAVAYMLDKDIWSAKFANTSFAEYAIGGPSIEMFFNSFNEKKNKKYKVEPLDSIGYYISKADGSGEFVSWRQIMGSSDSFYALNKGEAAAMWLASPAVTFSESVGNVNFLGYVNNTQDTKAIGFRPIVCLKSEVLLIKGTNGYDYNLKM